MKLKILVFLCIGIVTLSHSQSKKAWTIMIYIAANNDLNRYAEPNIKQMMEVGSNADRNIIFYLAETKDNQKYGKLFRVDKDALVELSCDNDIDSGSFEACLNACSNAFTEHPAEHNALIFWNHGAGCLNMPFADLFKGIAYDQACDTYLSDKDVVAILKEVTQNVFGGKKFDILGFDACLMASLELQTSCAPYANYYVASEEVESAHGWNYTQALEQITAKSTALEIIQKWVSSYGQFYESSHDWYTLSAIDLTKIIPVACNVDILAKNMIDLLESYNNQDLLISLQESTTPGSVVCFDKPEHPDYIDLDNLYVNLLERISTIQIHDKTIQDHLENFVQLLTQGRNLISQAVVANVVGNRHAQAKGISIYWAQEMIHPSYSSLVWTQLYSHWYELMDYYLQLKK